MLKTIIITNDPSIAADAEAAGVSRIMVDLEIMGKKERQASRNTFITTHTKEDIAPVRAVLKTAELMVRINPWHNGSLEEIEEAITRGAQRIMLPMIESVDDFRRFSAAVAGRVRILPLVENAYSMEQLDDILQTPHVDEVYFGLNDLHLSLGHTFLFEPLALGMLDTMAATAKAQNIPFGFGGMAMIGQGELPAEMILGEHVRLGSSCVILSSRFCKDIDINTSEGRVLRLQEALKKIGICYDALLARSPEETKTNHQQVVEKVHTIASTLRDKLSSST